LVALITIYLAALWPLVSSTAFGIKMIHQDYLKMSKILQLTRSELLVDIILPLIVPYIFDGIRRSLWIAWVTIIPIEMLLEDKGLGHWVWNAYNEEMQEQIIIGMVLIYVLGSIIGYVLKLIADYFNYMD
jgi:nitrate/nitrite transport system permease protein